MQLELSAQGGGPEATERPLALLHDELRILTGSPMRRERRGHDLSVACKRLSSELRDEGSR